MAGRLVTTVPAHGIANIQNESVPTTHNRPTHTLLQWFLCKCTDSHSNRQSCRETSRRAVNRQNVRVGLPSCVTICSAQGVCQHGRSVCVLPSCATICSAQGVCQHGRSVCLLPSCVTICKQTESPCWQTPWAEQIVTQEGSKQTERPCWQAPWAEQIVAQEGSTQTDKHIDLSFVLYRGCRETDNFDGCFVRKQGEKRQQ